MFERYSVPCFSLYFDDISAYIFICVYVFFQLETYKNEPIQLFKLRQPGGTGAEYNGPWSRDSDDWDSVPHKEKERINAVHLMEGEFWYRSVENI